MRWIGDQSIGQERGILGRIGGGGIDPVEGVDRRPEPLALCQLVSSNAAKGWLFRASRGTR